MKSSNSGPGRHRRSAEQRQRLLARFHKSHMTQQEFAVHHGVGLSTLSKWLRCEDNASQSPVKFKEVVLPHKPLGYAVEVVSPLGWTVRLQNSSELQMLPQVLQALPC